jgi:hypothetical protein
MLRPFNWLRFNCTNRDLMWGSITKTASGWEGDIFRDLDNGWCRTYLTLIMLMWRIGWDPNSIPIYIQQDATLHSLFISGYCSTCFGWYFHPSSGANKTASTAFGICHTVTAICRFRGKVGTGLCCRCSFMRSWWWVEVPPETCRAVSRHKLCNVASCWIYTYIVIYLGCTDP